MKNMTTYILIFSLVVSWCSTPPVISINLAGLIPAALIYGLTYVIIVLEGATVPMGVPFAIFGHVTAGSHLPAWRAGEETPKA